MSTLQPVLESSFECEGPFLNKLWSSGASSTNSKWKIINDLVRIIKWLINGPLFISYLTLNAEYTCNNLFCLCYFFPFSTYWLALCLSSRFFCRTVVISVTNFVSAIPGPYRTFDEAKGYLIPNRRRFHLLERICYSSLWKVRKVLLFF